MNSEQRIEKGGGRAVTRLFVVIVTIVLLILTYWLQAYRLTGLEESYIFLFDAGYIADSLSVPGGLAQLVASFLTQFMRYVWVGPLLTAAIYLGIMVGLVRCCRKPEPAVVAFAAVPCLCLFLCLESVYYKYQGHVAMLFLAMALWGYVSAARRSTPYVRLAIGAVLSMVLYYAAGSGALFAGLGMLLSDIVTRSRRWWLGAAYIILPAVMGWVCYQSGLTYTLAMALTPAMYYDLNSTYYMMIYALAGLPVCMVAAPVIARESKDKHQWIWALVLLVVIFASMLNVYAMTHSASGYATQKMRYHALHDQWDEIADMPYDGSATPFTSYRFLALAKKGELDKRMLEYRPFIDYFMKNQPLVKKADQQMMSDMYYQCEFMAAARRAAFDTDIVTPGAFNPEETCKLVNIHLAYGNYRVAEKLISQLEKTLFYRSWATDMRRYLDNDALVEADSVLGPKRRAIPATNNYISPWGLQRDLHAIVETNPGQVAAAQFLNAFMILTFQK